MNSQRSYSFVLLPVSLYVLQKNVPFGICSSNTAIQQNEKWNPLFDVCFMLAGDPFLWWWRYDVDMSIVWFLFIYGLRLFPDFYFYFIFALPLLVSWYNILKRRKKLKKKVNKSNSAPFWTVCDVLWYFDFISCFNLEFLN